MVLADHTLLLAIPAFVPAVIVVGVVIFVAMRDRRTPDDESHDDESHEVESHEVEPHDDDAAANREDG
jgi:hypothetical protein